VGHDGGQIERVCVHNEMELESPALGSTWPPRKSGLQGPNKLEANLEIIFTSNNRVQVRK
jgi:hypothetical protein